MNEMKRVSPVVLKGMPVKTETKDNWEVVKEYKGEESDGPFLVDLTHKQRFDFQDAHLEEHKPFQMTLPKIPGESVIDKKMVVNRMNTTQISIYNLGENRIPMPESSGFTDVTEATIFVALLGKSVFQICEKLTALDFMDSERKTPFLLQGPFSHVPCQIVTLSKNIDNSGVILTCSKGYGRDMTHAILNAGKEFGLKPGGEEKFNNFINEL